MTVSLKRDAAGSILRIMRRQEIPMECLEQEDAADAVVEILRMHAPLLKLGGKSLQGCAVERVAQPLEGTG